MSRETKRCSAMNKEGMPCRAAATDIGYCYFHSNPEKVAELGRSGGRKNRHRRDEDARPLPHLDSLAAVKEAVAIIIEDVHAKRLNPKAATGMAPLLNTLLRTFHSEELETRIDHLEQQLEQLNEKAAEVTKGLRENGGNFRL